MDITREWKRVETWMSAHAPALIDAMADGADAPSLDRLEAALSVKLPPEMRALYQIHDGQSDVSLNVVPEGEWLSLRRIEDEWRVWKGLLDGGDFKGSRSEPDRGIRDDWWHPLWVPFTYNGSGDHSCVDLAPAAGGAPGQIISMWHDDPARQLLAPSLAGWVRRFADDLDQGKFVFSEEEGGLFEAG